MNTVVERFRWALGGFNRQDVLRYVERSELEHCRSQSELERQLAQSEQERARLAQSLSGLEEQNSAICGERDRAQVSLKASTQALARLQEQLRATEEKLEDAGQELDQARSQVEELSARVQSYQELEDRIATVELEARRKAQNEVDGARMRADALVGEARRWLGQALEQYGQVRREAAELFRGARELAALEEEALRIDQLLEVLREKAGLE